MAGGKDERDISGAWADFDKAVANKPLVAPSTGQAESMLMRGEAWLYVSSAARAKLSRDQGSPIGFSLPKEGSAIALPNFMAPVKNSKNPIAAQRVLNHLLSPEVQAKLAQVEGIVPVNSKVQLSADLKEQLGFDRDKPIPAMHVLDTDAINQQLDGWIERFNRSVAR